MTDAEAFEVLKGCALFEGLADKELQWVQSQMIETKLEERESLFQQGDASHGACIIIDGELGIRSHVMEEKGSDAPFTPVIAHFGPGDVIGEFALLDSLPRSAEVFAIKPSHVMTFEQDALAELGQVHPAVGYQIMRNLAIIIVQRMRRTNEQFASSLQWNWKKMSDPKEVTSKE